MIFSSKSNRDLPDQDFEFQSEPSLSDFSHKKTGGPVPNTITAGEILGNETENVNSGSALEALRKKIETASAVPVTKAFVSDDPAEIVKEFFPEQKTDSTTKTEKIEPVKNIELQNNDEDVSLAHRSLLDKCMPYILDEEGNEAAAKDEPIYKLESVAEILKSDSEKLLRELSEKYGIDSITSEIKQENYKTEETPVEPVVKDKIPEVSKNPETESQKPIYDTISDIDISDFTVYKTPTEPEVNTETVTFTPISEKKSKKISVSTQTRSIDFTNEFIKPDSFSEDTEGGQTKLERTEFDEYVPDIEYEDLQTGKKILKSFVTKAKNSLISCFISFIALAAIAVFKIPFLNARVINSPGIFSIVTASILLVSVVSNFRMFISLPKAFGKNAIPECNAALAVLFSIPYIVLGIIRKQSVINTVLLIAVIVFFNALSVFMKNSADLRSFRQIFSSSRKHAVKLISDPALTFAMAKDAVEGDTLIAASQSTSMTEDHMKYSTFGVFLNSKAAIINIVSVAFSILLGFLASVYFGNTFSGAYVACCVQCFTALPSLFFIDRLPFYSSSKRLVAFGAMISGKTGAEQVEQVNAVVLKSSDLFPSGTVTMHQMQVLSENDLQDTIIRAASLTEAMESPLSAIFKQIAGTGNISEFPVSDTVKYEENLGISGWVDDRLLFIGNRTLMEAHGITVPPVETDRKILRQGFFPVYVASGNKACAMITIQYKVRTGIARELQKLTGEGVTVLVNSCDPNMTSEMICDYFALYNDSVKTMSSAGNHIYDSTVSYVNSVSAPAAFKSNPMALPAIINCAIKIKRSNILLTVCYSILAVFGIVIFGYVSFGGSGTPMSDIFMLVYSLISAVISYIIFLVQKP